LEAYRFWLEYSDERDQLRARIAGLLDERQKDDARYERDKARIAALEKDAARTVTLLKALRSVRSLLDGMENWSNHDVYANARCAFSTADDAIEGDAALNPQHSGTATGREARTGGAWWTTALDLDLSANETRTISGGGLKWAKPDEG
jgi:hypothetical protein